MRRLALLALGLLAACTAPEPRAPVNPGAPPSCREAWAGGGAPIPRERCRKQWTALLYMAADDEELPPFAYWHLYGMEAAFPDGRSAASTLDADVVVQLDVDAPPGVRRIHVEPSGAPYAPDTDADDFRDATPDEIRSPVVASLDEDTGSPAESLRRFLDWGVSAYPSERYLVVVWGHGLGWRPAGLPANEYDPGLLRGGVAFDDHAHSTLGGSAGTSPAAPPNPRTVLDTPGLAAALAAVSRDRLGGRPFDVHAADACLMQSLEVAAELSGVARYLVGSEQIEDWLGIPWRSVMPTLNGTASPPPAPPACPAGDAACRVAAGMPALQREAFLPGGLFESASRSAAEGFTLSTLDAAAIPRAARPAVHRLGAAIADYLREEPLRGIDLSILVGVNGAPSFLGGTRDLGTFLEGLRAAVQAEADAGPEDGSSGASGAAARLLDAIHAARGALDQAVIAAAFGAEYDAPRWAGRAGVSIWIPRDAEEHAARRDFFAPARLHRPPPAEPRAAWLPWLDLLFAEEPAASAARGLARRR